MALSLWLVINSLLLVPQSGAVEDVDTLIARITPPQVRDSSRPGMRYLAVQKRMFVGRRDALEKLHSMGSRAEPAVAILTRLIKDPIEPAKFKLAEIRILGAIGAGAEASKPALKAISVSGDRELRAAANLALLQIERSLTATQFKELPILESKSTDSRIGNARKEFERNKRKGIVRSLPLTTTREFANARFSPCSQYVAQWRSPAGMFSTSFADLQIFEVSTGKECLAVDGRFNGLFFSPDGQKIVVNRGNSMSVWDCATGEWLAQLGTSRSLSGITQFETHSAYFRQNGRVLATVDRKLQGHGEGISLWDTETWAEIRTPVSQELFETTFLSVDARVVAVCIPSADDRPRKIRLFEIESSKELPAPEIDDPRQFYSTDAPDRIGVSTGEDWFVWDLSSRTLTKQPGRRPELLGIPPYLRDAYRRNWTDWLKEGVTADLVDGTWKVTEIATGRRVNSFANPTTWKEEIDQSQKYLLNKRLMMLTTPPVYAGQVCTWEIDQPKAQKEISFEWPVEGVAVGQDSRRLAVLERRHNEHSVPQAERRVSIIDTERPEAEPKLLTEERVLQLRNIRNSDLLAMRYLEKIELWHWSEQVVEKTIRVAEGETILAFDCLPAKQQIAIAVGTYLQLRDWASGTVRWRVQLKNTERLQISPDGKYIAVSVAGNASARQIMILSTADGRVLKKAETRLKIDHFHFWNEAQILAIVHSDGRVAQLDLEPDTDLRNFQPDRRTLPVEWQKNATTVCAIRGLYAIAGSAFGSGNGKTFIRINDLIDGKPRLSVFTDLDNLKCVSFYPNGRVIAGGGAVRKQRIDLVNLETGSVVGTIDGQTTFLAKPTPEGDILATRDLNSDEVTFWRTNDGAIVGRLSLRTGVAGHFDFSPDGKSFLTSGRETLIWDLEKLLSDYQSRN